MLRIAKKHEERGTNGRVRYDAGDLELEVDWFQRDISGGDKRRIFRCWARNEGTCEQGPNEVMCHCICLVLCMHMLWPMQVHLVVMHTCAFLL